MLKKVTERRSGNTLNLYFRLRNSVGLPADLTSDFYSFFRRLQWMSRYTYVPTYPNSRIQNLLTYSRFTLRYISCAVKLASLKDLEINEFRTQLSASCIFSEEFRNVVLWPRRIRQGKKDELNYDTEINFFIFTVAPCISKIHLSLHTNKCTIDAFVGV
jgi:hypothetical protein